MFSLIDPTRPVRQLTIFALAVALITAVLGNPAPKPQVVVTPVPIPIPSPNLPSVSVVIPTPTVTLPSPTIIVPTPTITIPSPTIQIPTTVTFPSPTIPSVITIPAPTLTIPTLTISTPTLIIPTVTLTAPCPPFTISSPTATLGVPFITLTNPTATNTGTTTQGSVYPTVFALPGYANVTRSPSSSSLTSTGSGTQSSNPLTSTSTSTCPCSSPTLTGDSVFAHGQAFVFTPPTFDQGALDPYAGPFSIFRPANLNFEQEQILTNRSYYFKAQPYSGQAQVQLSSNWTDPESEMNSPAGYIPDIRFPVPVTPQLAPASSNNPPSSRQALNISQTNGVLLIDQTWNRVPPGFVPTSPIQSSNGAVLMPYQVAPLPPSQGGQQPTLLSQPQGADTSYMVLQPYDLQAQVVPVSAQQASSPAITQQVAVISDIDDVLKVTNVSSPVQGLLNSFVETYQPVLGMPNVFQGRISQALAGTSTAVTFHYISGSPIPLAPSLLQFLWAYYPFGSLTLRPTTTFDVQSFYNYINDVFDNGYRLKAHQDILNTFSSANAVIFGDTAQRTFSTYLDVIGQYPSRVQCLYLRNLTIAEDTKNPAYGITRDEAVNRLRQRLPQDQQFRADSMLVTFSNPSDILGLDWTQDPPKCS